MNRPKIFVVPPEHLEKAWPSIEALDLVAPSNPGDDETRKEFFDSIKNSVANGSEELHVVVNGAGETVACFTAFETKDNGLLVRFIAGKDVPVWLGYLMRNIFEMASSRGFSYTKVVSRSF